ncbi:MAG TPA: V4R domain-containing protein [Aggregatilineales bacterium]|nr:V4R domain-containing protein [Aggregatilineales bacterium]
MTMPIPPSKLYYPNQIGRIYFDAIEKIIGNQAMPGFLRDCGLERYAAKRPPSNLSREFDFSDFSMLTAGLAQAEAEGRVPVGSSAEAGRLCFKAGMKGFGGVAAFGHAAAGLQVLPPVLKLKIGLLAMSTIFTTLSDQRTELVEHEGYFEYVIVTCPMCWGRHADSPVCQGAGGLLAEGIEWNMGRPYEVVETSCHACGDEYCVFRIEKPA